MTEEENSRLHELELLRKQELAAKQDEIDTLTSRLKKAESEVKHAKSTAEFEVRKPLQTRSESLQNQLESVQQSLDEAHSTANARMAERESKFNEIEHDLRKSLLALKEEVNTAKSHASHLEKVG